MTSLQYFVGLKNKDLSGTYIRSDQRISVFSGNKRVFLGPTGSTSTIEDMTFENLQPSHTAGQKFIMLPVPDQVRRLVYYANIHN